MIGKMPQNALTREQKSAFREAKRYGGTASDIMKNHQVDELAKQEAGGGKRKVGDDTGVEGARPGLLEGLHCLPGMA